MPGSERVQELCRPDSGTALFFSRLTATEIASALASKVRDRRLSMAECDRLWELFRRHAARQYHVLALDEATHALAEELLFRRTLASAEALHIAAAMQLMAPGRVSALVFWTADRRQADAARAEGLRVVEVG